MAHQERSWEKPEDVEKNLLKADITLEESQAIYKSWAKTGSYDKMLSPKKTKEYGALPVFSAFMSNLFPEPDKVLVLDIGAGTGLACETLVRLGYKNIDALEPLAEFVETLRSKNIYRKIFQTFIDSNKPLDIPDDTYDAIVATGAFAPGHVPCCAIHEIIRLVKPGGYFVNLMREQYLTTVPEYRGQLKPLLKQMEEEGEWKNIKWEVYPNHFRQTNGIIMAYQIC